MDEKKTLKKESLLNGDDHRASGRYNTKKSHLTQDIKPTVVIKIFRGFLGVLFHIYTIFTGSYPVSGI